MRREGKLTSREGKEIGSDFYSSVRWGKRHRNTVSYIIFCNKSQVVLETKKLNTQYSTYSLAHKYRVCDLITIY